MVLGGSVSVTWENVSQKVLGLKWLHAPVLLDFLDCYSFHFQHLEKKVSVKSTSLPLLHPGRWTPHQQPDSAGHPRVQVPVAQHAAAVRAVTGHGPLRDGGPERHHLHQPEGQTDKRHQQRHRH